MSTFDQAISLAGAALILYGYFALQRGWMNKEQRSFNAINLVGSMLLAYSAIRSWNLGVVVLESSWALLSIPGTFRAPKSK